MLLQTNSYVVPKEKRSEHVRLLRRFKQVLHKLGCDHFEVYEQVGTNWTSDQTSGRFVQIMRFRDRKQQMAVQAAERDDPIAQAVIAEFCELINFPYQQQQGLFAIGYYTSILSSGKLLEAPTDRTPAPPPETAPAIVGAVGEQMTMVVDPSELADAVDEGHPHAEGEPVRSPFADAPIVEPLETAETAHPVGANGDGHKTQPAADATDAPEPPKSPAHAAVDDLDELIRQRFGETPVDENEVANNGEAAAEIHSIADVAEAVSLPYDDAGLSPEVLEGHVTDTLEPPHTAQPPHPPEPEENTLPGSGIGAVLDASLHGDDEDLDIPLPAELLEPPDSSGSHPSGPFPSTGTPGEGAGRGFGRESSR